MYAKIFPLLLPVSFIACQANSAGNNANKRVTDPPVKSTASINPYSTIAAIPLPAGYKRLQADSNSFAKWLENIRLKKDKTVYLFNGTEKQNQQAQFAVLDISTGDKDLQQCADAVMRLRAEYLFASGQYNKILFTDNGSGIYQFTAPFSKDHLHVFLQTVFGMCGSASLAKQLKHTNLSNIQPGDVLIRGGFPGHAAMVMDVAVNDAGNRIYLLAQSYMPAQDIHVLVNPNNSSLSPWYEVNDAEEIVTPEYLFTRNELKRW